LHNCLLYRYRIDCAIGRQSRGWQGRCSWLFSGAAADDLGACGCDGLLLRQVEQLIARQDGAALAPGPVHAQLNGHHKPLPPQLTVLLVMSKPHLWGARTQPVSILTL